MTPKYTVEVLEDLAAIRSLSDKWMELDATVPMRQPWWHLAWWDAFQPAAKPYVMVAFDPSGTLQGVLPLYREPIGSGRYALRGMADGSVFTDYVSVAADPRAAAGVASAFADFLSKHATHALRGWDQLVLDGVAESDEAMQEFVTMLESHGAQALATTRSHFWRLPTDQTSDQWLKGMSRSSRRLFRKRISRLDQLSSFRLREPSSMDEVDSMTREVVALHQQRWNEQGMPGSFADPRMLPFIINVNREAYRYGSLHLGLWELEGKAVAGEIGFSGDSGVLFLYCVGRDPHSTVEELGLLQTLAGQLRAFHGSMQAIDYLRGDEPYKKRSQAVPTPCVQLRVSAPFWTSRFRHALWSTGFSLTQLLRRHTGRSPYRYAEMNKSVTDTVLPDGRAKATLPS